MFEIIEEVRRK